MPKLRKAYLFIYLIIYSCNFCSVFEEFDGRMDNVKTRIRIKHDGHCFWAAPFVFKTSCHFKVQDFPFDKQQCKLKFGSWLFTSKDLDLFRKNETAQVAENMLDNGEACISELMHQDGRKKRTAKHLCVTNMTGLLLVCFVETFT